MLSAKHLGVDCYCQNRPKALKLEGPQPSTYAVQKHVDHYYWPRFMPNSTLLKREHWCALALLRRSGFGDLKPIPAGRSSLLVCAPNPGLFLGPANPNS